MALPPARAGGRAPAPPPVPPATQTIRDKVRGRDRIEIGPAQPPPHSTRRDRASCRKSSNTCPHTTKFRKCKPAGTLVPGSLPEDLSLHQPPARPPAAPAAMPRSTAQTPPTRERRVQEEEK